MSRGKWSSDHLVGVMIHERLWSTLGGGFSFFFLQAKGQKDEVAGAGATTVVARYGWETERGGGATREK